MANVKKRVKRRLPLLIIFFVLLIGVGFLLYPKVSNWLSVYTSKVEIKSYNQTVKKLDNTQIEEIEKQAKDYNKALSERNQGKLSAYNYNSLMNISDVIGYVDIPKINVYQPIYHGISEDVLQKGIGHIDTTSLPVGGESTHSVLSGHTGLPSAELFTDIDQLVVGDVFYIHVLGKVLAYKVDQIKVVLPDDDSDIGIIDDKDYVTLLTCTPYGINDHRLLVRGARIPYTPKADDNTQTAPPTEPDSDGEEMIPVEQIALYAALICSSVIITISLLILFLPVGRRNKNKKNKNKS